MEVLSHLRIFIGNDSLRTGPETYLPGNLPGHLTLPDRLLDVDLAGHVRDAQDADELLTAHHRQGST